MKHAFAALIALGLAVPTARADDMICFNAVPASTLVAPMEALVATNLPPADARQKILKEASGGACLEIAQGKGNPPKVMNGSALYAFTVEEDGDYILWCRVWWSDECSNSFSVNADSANPFILGEDSTFKTWHWVKAPPRLKQLTLTKGVHTLTFRNREDGVYLTQVVLTRDKKFVPVDEEPVTTKIQVP